MRLVRFSTRPAQISPDIRAALTSLGRGDDRTGGIGLVGVQPPETDAPVDAVVVTAHGVVVVVGVDLPDPAIRLEAPLHGVWKADDWPLARGEGASGPDAGNPAEDALALSEQVAQRVRTTAGSTELAVGTVIAVGPFVEHVDQPAAELSGPVRIVYPTSTSLLASIVSLSSTPRPLTVAQARAVITALSPDTELDDDTLAGEGFAAGDAASTHPTTDVADSTDAADPLTDDADTEALDHTPRPSSPQPAPPQPTPERPDSASSAANPDAATDAAAGPMTTSPTPTSPTAPVGTTTPQPGAPRTETSAAGTPGTAVPAAAPVPVPGTTTVAANPSDSPSARAAAPATSTASGPAGAPQPLTAREAQTGGAATSAGTAAPWQAPRPPARPTPRASAPPTPQAGRPLPQAGAGRQPHAVLGAAAGAAAVPAPGGPARPARWRRLSAQTWRWIAAGAAFVVAVVVIITFTAMSGGDTDGGPVRTSAGGLEFTQRAAQLTEECADHAVGDVSVALADGGCTELRRGSFTTTVRGTDVAVSVAALTFTDRQAAQRFLEVADTPGTGTIRDLATTSGRWAPPPPDWSGAAYVSDLEGSTVRLVLASPRDRAPAESPEVTEAAEAALGLVKLND